MEEEQVPLAGGLGSEEQVPLAGCKRNSHGKAVAAWERQLT